MAIYRSRPTVGLNDNQLGGVPNRSDWYGEAYTLPIGTARQSLADEGSYWSIVNATATTTIAGHAAPSLANNDPTPTKSLLHIFNSGQRYISLDYLQLRVVVINASATQAYFFSYVDALGATGKTSGGTVIVPANLRSDQPTTTGAVVTFGAVVTAASATVKKVDQWPVRGATNAVAEDQYVFRFGADPANAGYVATLNYVTVNMPPVTLAPGGNFYLAEGNPSGAITAATYEFKGGYWER